MFLKHTSLHFSGFCLAVLLSAGSVAGQVKGDQPLKCSIKIGAEKIVRGQPIPVEITIENVSGSEVNLDAGYSFNLLKIADESIARKFARLGDSYWSPFDIFSGNPHKLGTMQPAVAADLVPKEKLRLVVGEVRTFKVDLAKLCWSASILSGWPNSDLFDEVPKGRYWLEFSMRGYEKTDKEINSNRVEITVG